MIELWCGNLSARCVWLYVIIMSRTSFRVNPHPIVCLNVMEHLARSNHHIWSLSDMNQIRTHDHLVGKQRLNHLVKLAKWFSCVVSTYLYGAIDCMLLPCPGRALEWIDTQVNVKELLTQSRQYTWSLSDRNEIRTHNYLIRKRKHNHLAKLAKWLSCVVKSYLQGAFNCKLLSYHIQVTEWIHNLYFPGMSRNSLLQAGATCEI